MDKSSEYHRDIFSGMVAESLHKEGYFGEEYQVFAFLYRLDGVTGLAVHEDELSCAQQSVQLLRQGAIVSKYASRRVRSPALAAQAHIELVQRLSEEIQMALAELFDAKVQAIDALPQNDCCEAAIAEYVQQDTGLNGQTEALIGLLAAAKRYHSLSPEGYERLRAKLPAYEEAAGKKLYGYRWLQEGQWRAYCNGYLPMVLQKWQAHEQQKELVTPIISQQYPLQSQPAMYLKKEFEQYMLQVFDEDYLRLYEQLLKNYRDK